MLHLLREEAKAAALEAEPESGLDSLAPSPRSRFANLSLSDSTPGPSPTTSNAESAILRRPELQPLRHDSAFGHGSFSISDLVAAGAMASVAPTPSASGTVSGASTPGGRALTRSGSGFFNQLYRISTPGVAEDPDAEAEAEAAAEGAKDGEEDEEGSGDGAGEEEDDEDEAGPSTSGKGAGRSTGACVNAYQLKPLLIQAIQELIDELETVHLNVAKDAKDHVHSG